MIDLVRGWLLRVTGAAMVAALADSLMPKGPVRQAGKLACGLLMLWAVLSPALQLRPALQGWGADWQNAVAQRQRELEEQSGAVLKTVIERQTAAYIVDKAEQLGAACTVQVVCTAGEDGSWSVWSVRLEGGLTGSQQEALSALLQEELGVPVQRQSFLGGE